MSGFGSGFVLHRNEEREYVGVLWEYDILLVGGLLFCCFCILLYVLDCLKIEYVFWGYLECTSLRLVTIFKLASLPMGGLGHKDFLNA